MAEEDVVYTDEETEALSRAYQAHLERTGRLQTHLIAQLNRQNRTLARKLNKLAHKLLSWQNPYSAECATLRRQLNDCQVARDQANLSAKAARAIAAEWEQKAAARTKERDELHAQLKALKQEHG